MHNPIIPSTHENIRLFKPTIKVSEKFNKTTFKTKPARDEIIQRLGRGMYGDIYQKNKNQELYYKSGVK